MTNLRFMMALTLGALAACSTSTGGSGKRDAGSKGDSSHADTTALPPKPDASEPAVKQLSAPEVDFETWARAEAWLSRCLGRDITLARFDAEVISSPNIARRAAETRCVAQVVTCGGALFCTGFDPGSPSCVIGQSWCEEDTKVECVKLGNSGKPKRTSCTGDVDGNVHCVVDSNKQAQCGTKECFYGGTSEDDRCTKNTFRECSDNVERLTDCALRQATCSSGWGGCRLALPEPACGVGVGAACSGSRVALCEDKGHAENWWECKWMSPDLKCQQFPGLTRACGLAPLDRVCESGEAECDGSAARICQGGKWLSVPCDFAGDGQCQVDGSGIRCVP